VGGQEKDFTPCSVAWKRILLRCYKKVGRTVNLKSKKLLNCSEEGTFSNVALVIPQRLGKCPSNM
jgi:hypothetical protein